MSLLTVVWRFLPLLILLLAWVQAGFAAMFNRSRFMAPVVIALFAGLNLLFCGQLLVAALVPEKGLFNRAGFLLSGFFLSGFLALWFYGQ